MSWKCDFCSQRIFITKTSYINYIKRYLKSVDSSEELSLEVMIIDSLESENLLNNENNFESIHENSNEDEDEDEDDDDDSNNAEAEEESLTSNISHSNSSEELSLEVMIIDSLESENLLNNENNFESIHENSNEDEDEDEDDDDDSNNAEAEEESLTSNISHSSVLFFENMELSNNDAENYSFNNYTSDNNNICKEAEPIEFPNNVYADLMALVTNYNLSNEATNAVIHFFNENSNLPLSPLPKNAKKGCELISKLLSIILYSDATIIDTLDIDLEVNNETYWFFSCISTIICDWPETATFNLIHKSTNSNFSCHFCLILKTLLSNTDLSNITFCNNENMQEYFYNDIGQDFLPSINVYTATVPDRMYHLDLRSLHYQIKFTQALL
ncbi:hypothetical protein Glove_48g201 [Diversispora epigaea]|uniref:Uncharacterized protein n=1 Tax=Diversispora epigaea TaxID=1348612 RepID=A0A397JHD6_9GLOM|nr:hypothetical protein Glove_48g201 [Diversispora epigaea]